MADLQTQVFDLQERFNLQPIFFTQIGYWKPKYKRRPNVFGTSFHIDRSDKQPEQSSVYLSIFDARPSVIEEQTYARGYSNLVRTGQHQRETGMVPCNTAEVKCEAWTRIPVPLRGRPANMGEWS